MMPSAKILLIDDEEAFLSVIKRRLEKRGFLTLEALSGPEGIQVLQDNLDVDVVILDVKMPGMDGIQALKEIKRQFPLLEVIMLTAHGTMESAVEGMNLGAFDYLMKPYEMPDMSDKIERATKKKREFQQKIMEAEARELGQNRSN